MGTITILFVDQVGSTLQLSTLGDNSAVEILDQLQAVVTDHLERYQGVFHKHTGDGFMASFASCVDAVESTLSLQATTSEFNADLPFERRVVLRMGLHTGEPLARPSGPVGAAVVVAARLCALAGAGQVLVSDVARMMLEPRRAFVLTPVGARRLKGFSDPMLCYLVRSQEQSAAPTLPPELDAGRDMPFIGRAAELDRLRLAFVEAAEGTATALVVAGGAGAGQAACSANSPLRLASRGGWLFYTSGVDAVDMVAGGVGSRHDRHDPAIAIADDVTDSATIRDIVAPLRAASSTRLLMVIATTLTDLGERVFGVPVVHLGGLPADDVKYLLEVGGGAGDVEARARELVAAAHGAPGAVRAALAEGTETAIREDLRDAIAQAITGQEKEERSSAAITAGLLALRGDAATGPGSATGETPPSRAWSRLAPRTAPGSAGVTS